MILKRRKFKGKQCLSKDTNDAQIQIQKAMCTFSQSHMYSVQRDRINNHTAPASQPPKYNYKEIKRGEKNKDFFNIKGKLCN